MMSLFMAIVLPILIIFVAGGLVPWWWLPVAILAMLVVGGLWARYGRWQGMWTLAEQAHWWNWPPRKLWRTLLRWQDLNHGYGIQCHTTGAAGSVGVNPGSTAGASGGVTTAPSSVCMGNKPQSPTQ